MLHPSDHLQGPLLDPTPTGLCLCPGNSVLNAVLQWDLTRSEQRGTIISLVLAILLLVQDTVGFLSCRHNLPAHVQHLIRQQSEALLLRVSLSKDHPAHICTWDCTYPCARLCIWPCWTACCFMVPSQKSVKVPLDGISSFQYINYTTHLGIVSKLVECCIQSHCPIHQWRWTSSLLQSYAWGLHLFLFLSYKSVKNVLLQA